LISSPHLVLAQLYSLQQPGLLLLQLYLLHPLSAERRAPPSG
jgi:hypothetical protein